MIIKIATTLIVGTGVVGLILILAICQGFVFATLWGWFVVPALDVKPISITMGVGLIALTTIFHRPLPKMENDENLGKMIGNVIGVNLIPLFVGWLAKLAMGA